MYSLFLAENQTLNIEHSILSIVSNEHETKMTHGFPNE